LLHLQEKLGSCAAEQLEERASSFVILAERGVKPEKNKIRLASVAAVCLSSIVVSLSIVRLILGPLYVMQDGCKCGLARRWIEFNESRILRGVKIGIHSTESGDPQHTHVFWDATWSARY
jgi:hypothetical protein